MMTKQDWCRNVDNLRINMINRMFKLGASKQLVPASMYHGLQAIEGLKHERSGRKRNRPCPAGYGEACPCCPAVCFTDNRRNDPVAVAYRYTVE